MQIRVEHPWYHLPKPEYCGDPSSIMTWLESNGISASDYTEQVILNDDRLKESCDCFDKYESAAITRAIKKILNDGFLTDYEYDCLQCFNLLTTEVFLETEFKNGRDY